MHDATGGAFVAMTDWDPALVRRLAEADLARLEYGAGTAEKKRRAMADAASLLPPIGCAARSQSEAQQCLETLCQFHAAGIDHVLLHGTKPARRQACSASSTAFLHDPQNVKGPRCRTHSRSAPDLVLLIATLREG